MSNKNSRRIFGSALAGLLLAGSALAGNGALLGVQVGYPVVNFVDGVPADGAVYNGSSLVVTGTPVFLTFTSSGVPEFISAGTLNITATINGAGVISGGSFSISGTVTNTATATNYTGVLLAGTVADYGIIDVGGPGGADLADFKMNATAGTLLGVVGGAGTQINASVTLEGSGFAGSFAAPWSASAGNGDVGPPPSGKTPFDCYGVNKVSTKNKSGTANDQIKVIKGAVRLDPPNSVNFATDMTQVRIDNYTVNIPAGSFVQIGPNDWKYKTATGVVPKITMRVNFDKATWEFDCRGCDASLVNFADGVDVCLMIGNYESCVNVPAGGGSGSSDHDSDDATGGHVSCKLPSGPGSSGGSDSGHSAPHRLSPLSSMTIEHTSGKRLTRSRVNGTLGHPITVFMNPALSPDLAIINTSGAVCLRCGDVDSSGKFTIVRLQGVPGDKMARACGVVNASCSIPVIPH